MGEFARTRPVATALVALAAALWGLDAWIRKPLAASTAVGTIVFGEHLVLVALTLPFLAGAVVALGTVLGRYLTRVLRFEHVATLRFAFGLAASAIALLVLGAPAFASGHDTFWIAVLAVVTGFVALFIYYYGLQVTPAVAATIAELAFPISVILVGYFKFGQVLTGWQW